METLTGVILLIGFVLNMIAVLLGLYNAINYGITRKTMTIMTLNIICIIYLSIAFTLWN